MKKNQKYDNTPPELKFFDPIVPELQYDHQFNLNLAYENKPIEIEAYYYEYIYPLLNKRLNSNPKYFEIINNVCTLNFFLDKVHIALNFLHNNKYSNDETGLQTYFNHALDEIGFSPSQYDIKNTEILSYEKHEGLQFLINAIIDSILKIILEERVINPETTGMSNSEFLNPNNEEQKILNKLKIGSTEIPKEIISNFVHSNLNTILNQIKETLKNKFNWDLSSLISMQ